ncbi:MAG: hypothetical protein HYY49_06225 [Ignavibacteriales bacterium]|nr:hypothetical protein [Ignavibacteriales bacterium]
MKQYSKKELSKKLSLYIDGELSESEKQNVDALLASDEATRRELNELKTLQNLILTQPKLQEDGAFWARLSSHLAHRAAEQEGLLPIPRRFIPVAAGIGVLALAAVGIVLFQNRSQLEEFISEKSKIVQEAYEEGVLKGSILPLFSDINKNQVLQFALFGSLPLDAKSETSLQVDEEAEKGYRIELGKTPVKAKTVTIRDLQREVDLTDAQTKTIDSMLTMMKRRIESSVLVAENDALVIDPDLPKMNRVMVSNIAASLEPGQRVRFNHFLEVRDAPYLVSTQKAPRMKREEMFRNIHRPHRSEKFVIVTPETVLISKMELNIDSIRSAFEEHIRNMPPMMPRADRIVRKLAERELAAFPRSSTMRSFQVYGDSQVFSIEIEKDVLTPEMGQLQIEVLPRIRATTRSRPLMRGFGFHFVAPGGPESLDVKFFDESSFDSMMHYVPPRYQKRYPPKLDSLMRIMEQRQIQEAAGAKGKPPARVE